ncbi:MAG: aldehyde ferredoxin oxidoreductase N-terminal domain-containing protein [Thermodesulfobacteriota bacterium]
MQDIIRANMRTGNVSALVLPEQYQDYGGRALTARILSEEVPPNSHSLGKNNKCIIATGLFAGTPFPCSNRCSIGAKSPLTGGIKESNVGGTVAFKLSKLNIRSVVIEDQPAEEHGLYILKLGKQTLLVEHRFNLAAGRQAVERLPEFFEIEPLFPHKTVYDVNSKSVIAEIGNKLGLQS